jgi:hypothetical protein
VYQTFYTVNLHSNFATTIAVAVLQPSLSNGIILVYHVSTCLQPIRRL